MKLVTYYKKNISNIGFVLDDYVFSLDEFFDYYKKKNKIKNKIEMPGNMKSLLELDFTKELKRLSKFAIEKVLTSKKEIKSLLDKKIIFQAGKVKLAAPVLSPQKIVCIGLNYMDHCREQHVEPPDHPVMFAKYPTSIVGQKDEVTWSPELTQQVDFEAELGVVIGKKARNVKAELAYDYIAGYICVNDISARDLQFSDGQWVRGKSLDTFCPMGPWIVTKDEIRDPHNLSIKCIVNDTAYQDSNTKEMIFKIPALIEFITKAFTLLPGDIVSTGTPDGVGVFRNPKVFLKPGDNVTVEIENIGLLKNKMG